MSWFINENELRYDFIRSSGPGGQNVNKVSTAVQLRFNIKNSPSLPGEVKTKLIAIAGNKVTTDGTLIIEASRYRSQLKNRQDARNRLNAMIDLASRKEKKRKKSRVPETVNQKRLQNKKRKSEIKKMRGKISPD